MGSIAILNTAVTREPDRTDASLPAYTESLRFECKFLLPLAKSKKYQETDHSLEPATKLKFTAVLQQQAIGAVFKS